MIENRDFLITGLQPWDIEIGSNAKNMALEISKHNRVLYVNTPLDFRTLLKGENNSEYVRRLAVFKGEESPLRQINENLWTLDFPFGIFPINKMKNPYFFNYFNKKNNRKICRFIGKKLKRLEFKNIIHLNDNDVYRSFYIKEFLKPDYSIYYRRDNLLSVPYWRKHGTRLEPKLIAKSDLIVTNSIQLADAVKIYNERTFDIGQGVDLSSFTLNSAFTVPQDIANLKKPIIGYAGYITSLRLDADLLYALAEKCPQYTFLFIGSEDTVFASHPIHELPNVHFSGHKENSLIADYIKSFDICINPQVVNEATIGNYPRKIDEYLALGKPTIATQTPTMKLFEGYVYLCNNTDEWLNAIETALSELNNSSKQQERISFAHSHTWENSIKKLYNHIEELNKYEIK